MPATNPDPTEVWENPVKKQIREGKAVIAATITVASPEIAARVATFGYDFLWIEMEHSPITLETLRNMVLATRGLPAIPFARVPVNELWTAKRVLDQGVMGVIFPFSSTPELAQQAAAACRYPPRGRRGYGPGLASFRWPAAGSYQDSVDREIVVIAMIEEARAVEQIEVIAATPGVDVLVVGTSDLSFSMGLRGQSDHPKVQEALEKVVAACKANHKAAGLPVKDLGQVERYQAQGFQLFQTQTELGLMARGAQQILESFGRQPPDAYKGFIY